MTDKLDWSKFEHYFKNGWADKMRPVFETKEMFETYQYLKQRGQAGANILPKAPQLYRAFEECSWANLKVVVLGYDPYPQWVKSGGEWKSIADGIAFSSSNVNKIPDSLSVLHDSWGRVHGDIDPVTDLKYLANQGVLLLNSALTVEENQIGSHSDKCPKGRIWEFFTQYVLDIISTGKKNVCYILLGREAHRYANFIPKENNLIIRAYHPSYYARIDQPMPVDPWIDCNHYVYDATGESIVWGLFALPF